jgi:hypothetical protein
MNAARAGLIALLLVAPVLAGSEPLPSPKALTRGELRRPGFPIDGAVFARHPGPRQFRASGGSAKTEAAVGAALEWLAARQRGDGSWAGGREPTAFAVLAFLGAGHDHRRGPYAATVRRGLRWLFDRQRDGGEGHAAATMAMVEGYSRTGSPLTRLGAMRGLDLLAGGSPGEGNHAAGEAWRILAQYLAPQVGLPLPADRGSAVRAWALLPLPPDGGLPLEAIWIWIREMSFRHSDELTSDDRARTRAAGAAIALPDGDPDAWFWGTLAVYRTGGKPWSAWNDAMKSALLPRQRKEPWTLAGSFDPPDPAADEEARVRATVLYTLCFEVYFLRAP